MERLLMLAERVRQNLSGRNDVRVAVLFGSEARSTSSSHSDVDLLVDAPSVDLLELQTQLTQALDQEVDIVELSTATIPLLEQVLREGIVVFEAFRGAGALWRSQTLSTLETDRPWYARMRERWLATVRDEGFPHG
jgi:predicted nucleotidyltransferase